MPDFPKDIRKRLLEIVAEYDSEIDKYRTYLKVARGNGSGIPKRGSSLS